MALTCDGARIGVSGYNLTGAKSWLRTSVGSWVVRGFAAAATTAALVAERSGSGEAAVAAAIVTAPVAVAALVHLWPTQVSSAAERAAGQVLGVPEEQLCSLFPRGTPYSRRKLDIVEELVTTARLRFGRLADSAADRLVVERWLGDQLQQMCQKEGGGGARKADVIALYKCIPYALELFFVPNYHDVSARHMARHSHVVKALRSGWEAASR